MDSPISRDDHPRIHKASPRVPLDAAAAAAAVTEALRVQR